MAPQSWNPNVAVLVVESKIMVDQRTFLPLSKLTRHLGATLSRIDHFTNFAGVGQSDAVHFCHGGGVV